MGGYDGDEYEDSYDYDMEGEEQEVEFDEEGEEYGEGEAEEEDRKPTEEEMEYLELRQRLKESIRQKRKKEGGSLLNAREKEKRLPYDNYGSFFGPSQPVISQRVIQESKSLLENKHLVSKMLESKNIKKVTSASNGTGSKLGANDRAPKISELKRKVEKLKMARDYSFLSDDAKHPVPAKEPLPRSISAPNSEAQRAHMLLKSKQPLRNASTSVLGVHEERKSLNGQEHARAQSYKPTSVSKPNLTSIDSKKQLGINNGIGPGRPVGLKGFPMKMPVASVNKKTPTLGAKNLPSDMQKPPSSKMHLSNLKRGVEQKKVTEEHTNSKILSKKPVPPSMSKQPAPLSILKRPAPLSMSKGSASSSVPKQPLQSSMSKKPIPSMSKKPIPSMSKKPIPSMSKQPVPSSMSRSQINKAPKQFSSHPTTQIQQPKKRKLSEEEEALEEIRRMFNTQRYAGCDDDDSDMEANFDEIMKEERRSAKIGRMEDEEQERLIQEEERRERMRKLAKKRKLSH